MNLFDFFRGRQKQSSASVAKERLQIIVAHERGQRSEPDYLPALQKELLEVIRKYVAVDTEAVKVDVVKDGEHDVLDISVSLPDRGAPAGA